MLRVRLLGSFELCSADGTSPRLPRKVRAIVAYLAMPLGVRRSRQQLAALLWSRQHEAPARHSLSQALSALREAVGDRLIAEDDCLSLAGSGIEVDVAAFERALADGTPAKLMEAVELYRGDFLDGLDLREPEFDDWVLARRYELREAASRGLWALLRAQREAASTDAMIETARRLVLLTPLDEPAHRALIELYGRQGQLDFVEAQYERCRDILQRELNLAPGPATREAWRAAVATCRQRSRAHTAPPEPMAPHRPEMPVPGAASNAGPTASGPDAAVASVSPVSRRGWRPVAAIAATVALALLAVGFMHPPWPDQVPGGAGKPSIAVLPFGSPSRDPADTYLADGFAEEIITELARNHELTVIARNTSFSFRGRPARVEDVARELDVRYVLDGVVRRSGDSMRLTTQLIDGMSGAQVWTERFEIGPQQLVATQDEIVRRIAAILFSEVRQIEKAVALRSSPTSFEVYTMALKGLALKHQFTGEAYREGRRLLRQAIELAPTYAPAYAYLGYLDAADCAAGYSGEKRPEDIDGAIHLIRTALHLDPGMAYAYQALGFALSVKGQPEEALAAEEKAVALGPGDADNQMLYGRELATNGRFAEAVAAGEKAFALNPLAPVYYHAMHARSLYGAADYEAVIETAAPCIERNSGHRACRALRAAAFVELGRPADAKIEIHELFQRAPDFTLKHAEVYTGYAGDQVTNARLLERLREAGLPAEAQDES